MEHTSHGDIYVDFSFERRTGRKLFRDLNLENAVTSVNFDYQDTKMHREYFISYPDNVLAMKFTADGNESGDFRVLIYQTPRFAYRIRNVPAPPLSDGYPDCRTILIFLFQ